MKLQLVPARAGFHWVRQGCKTFFRQPLALSGLFFLFVAVTTVAGMIPVLGFALALALLQHAAGHAHEVQPGRGSGRDRFGRLIFTSRDGETQEALPVRAFPIGAPDEGIALVDPHGHELAWIERLDDLPAELRQLVEGELASREFMPVIERIVDVTSYATPSTWQVITNRGESKLILKGEEDIRRLAGRTKLLIAASDGLQFHVPDTTALDRASRKLLERFL